MDDAFKAAKFDFRVRENAALLKRRGGRTRLDRRRYFRVRENAALLKPERAEVVPSIAGDFRVRENAALLKLHPAAPEGRQEKRFPRSRERGPIEARLRPGMWMISSGEFPRSRERGPIEARCTSA